MKFDLRVLAVFFAALVTSAVVASSFKPARPPAIPLAVKSPYLNTLLFAGSGGRNSGGHLAGQVRISLFFLVERLLWTQMLIYASSSGHSSGSESSGFLGNVFLTVSQRSGYGMDRIDQSR